MSTSTQKTLSEKQYSGQQVLKRSPIPALITAALFREVAKVKKVRKEKTIVGAESGIMDASVTDELVADHEWESMLHTFEPEADELSPGTGGAESDDLWERLSTTRWLKSSAPRDEHDSTPGSDETQVVSVERDTTVDTEG